MTGLRLSLLGFAAALGMVATATHPAQAEWKPERPIRIIVPWAAGGSTDQVTRIVAGELEEALGASVVVVNQPGASGSVGTKSTLEAPRDGYTWTAGAAKDLGTYKVSGMLDTDIRDWHVFTNVANVSVISVNPDTPYKDFGDLLNAMKGGKEVKVATAGLNSAGHYAIEEIKNATGANYKHVTYDGGNPAVIATVSGETDATTQLAVEQAEMIRAGKLRPLAVIGDQPLEIEGAGTIPPITNWVKDFKTDTNYFGIFIPKGVPDEVVQKVSQVWKDKIAKSEKLKKYAVSRGALFAPYSGEEAQKRVWPAIVKTAWLLQEAGKAKVSPDQVGIPKP